MALPDRDQGMTPADPDWHDWRVNMPNPMDTNRWEVDSIL
jgi:hypothetical protein